MNDCDIVYQINSNNNTISVLCENISECKSKKVFLEEEYKNLKALLDLHESFFDNNNRYNMLCSAGNLELVSAKKISECFGEIFFSSQIANCNNQIRQKMDDISGEMSKVTSCIANYNQQIEACNNEINYLKSQLI